MAAQVQELLRFLSTDGKIPLALAMGKIPMLREKGLQKKEDIAKSTLETLQTVFDDEKLAKQVLQAAQRKSRKRAAGDAPAAASKRSKTLPEDATPADLERQLTLPESVRDIELLSGTTIITNRAPLVLAFAVTLLKYTTAQPLSSRLSLAQAVVSANSSARASSLGIRPGKTAEVEGWGEGHPTMTVMNRPVYYLRRVETGTVDPEEPNTQNEKLNNVLVPSSEQPVWGLDLEAMRSASSGTGSNSAGLPIHTPQGARAYLLRSFASPAPAEQSAKKQTKAQKTMEYEHNLAMLLGALELLFESWSTLDKAELDRRTWSWYVAVRPEVQAGISGWAEKNSIGLQQILDLRKTG